MKSVNPLDILGLIIFFALVAGIAFFAFWVWMLIDCIRNKEIEGSEKAIWVGIILFGFCFGGLAYWFTKKTEDAKFFFKLIFSTILIVATATGISIVYNTTKEKYNNYQLAKTEEKRILEIENKRKIYDQKTVNSTGKNNYWEHPDSGPRPYKPLNQSATDKALKDPRDELNKSKYLLLNKSDGYRREARTPQEVANINTAKYSEKLNSWVDDQGNVHFTN